MEVEVKIKNHTYYFDLIKEDGWYEVIANNFNKKKIGFITFKPNLHSYYSSSLWIYKIFVSEDFRYKGVGQKLLNIAEEFAYSRNISAIEGRFYPDNSYAKDFYDKNGYEIYKDGYETYLIKVLNKNDIKQNQLEEFKKLEK